MLKGPDIILKKLKQQLKKYDLKYESILKEIRKQEEINALETQAQVAQRQNVLKGPDIILKKLKRQLKKYDLKYEIALQKIREQEEINALETQVKETQAQVAQRQKILQQNGKHEEVSRLEALNKEYEQLMYERKEILTHIINKRSLLEQITQNQDALNLEINYQEILRLLTQKQKQLRQEGKQDEVTALETEKYCIGAQVEKAKKILKLISQIQVIQHVKGREAEFNELEGDKLTILYPIIEKKADLKREFKETSEPANEPTQEQRELCQYIQNLEIQNRVIQIKIKDIFAELLLLPVELNTPPSILTALALARNSEVGFGAETLEQDSLPRRKERFIGNKF